MDRMEVDEVSQCCKSKFKSINIKKINDYNNQSQKWLVIQKSSKKQKPSLKVSLPIHYLKVMHKFKSSNVRMKTPNPNQTETSQQIGQPPRTPLRLSPSSLRKFRHPVPTSKGRTTLADKLDQIIKTPEAISKTTNLKCNPTMPRSDINTPSIEEPVKQKAEELKTSESKSNTTMLYKMNNEEPTISIKHKLPLTIVAPKCSYGNKSKTPVNKENLRTTNNTQTTVERAMQTENDFIVTEEDYQLLQTIKNSGLTYQYIQNQIIKTQMDKNNDNDCVVIDLESTEENNPSNDVLDTVMKHSNNNKSVLNIAAQYVSNMIKTNNDQPSAPGTVPPPERMTSTSDQQPYLAGPVPPATSETPSLSCTPVPYADMVNSFAVLATLQKMGFCLTNLEPPQMHKLGFRHTNNVHDPPQTQMIPRIDTQATQTGTQTGTQTENNYPKRRKNSHAQKAPVLITQQQELTTFRPQMQFQQFIPEHVEQSTQLLPSNIPGLIPHQPNQFIMPRNHNQYPFEHDTSSALRTPQIQVQMPSPVQLPSPARLHPNDPRNRTIQSQLGRPCMSRVLSTQEANLHSQAAHLHNPSWSYHQYVDRYGNAFPQGHQ